MNAITKKQIQLIHIAKQQLGLDDDLYRDILANMFNVRSSTGLSYAQGVELIEYFRRQGFVIRGNEHAVPENVIRLTTPAQRRLIGVLSRRFNWRTPDGFTLWLNRQREKGYIKSAALNESTDAAWVIEKLKQMTGTSTGNITRREAAHAVV